MLQVLWATDNGCLHDWEVDYIRTLLDGMDIPYRLTTVTSIEQIVPNALILINHSVNYRDYLRLYELTGTPFGVIHLSDEWFDDDVSFYDYNTCKFAWRNYYHEQFDKYNKLKPLPLSYKKGFWKDYTGRSPRDITFQERQYAWSFAGAPRTNERQATLKMFDEVTPYKIHFETGNSFSAPETGLDTSAYRELLLNTQFGLCAIGISKTLSGDTGRVTETLETGGIPIVLAGRNSSGLTYWESLYGELPPFVIGDTWEECLAKVKELQQNPDECERVRVACYDFWTRQKAHISKEFASQVTNLLRY
jgi:hypothetical protein